MYQNLPEIHWIIIFPRANLGFPAVLGCGLLRRLRCLRGLQGQGLIRGLQGQGLTLGLWLLAQLGMVSEKKTRKLENMGKKWNMLERKRETREMLERNRKTTGKNVGKTWAKDGKPWKKM